MAGVQHSDATAPTSRAHRTIPDATIARLPLYLRALSGFAEHGLATVSSGELADASGVNPAQLRKDLSHLGSYGTRGVGYDVAILRTKIGAQIGSTLQWSVVIVGMGNLGTALASYSGYAGRGFRVAALVDASDVLIGQRVRLEGNDPEELTITGDAGLAEAVREAQPVVGIITTPAEPAQSVCDRLVAAGVTSILNFAPTVLQVPEGVVVRTVDLGQELQILAYHQQHAVRPEGTADPSAGVDLGGTDGSPQQPGDPVHDGHHHSDVPTDDSVASSIEAPPGRREEVLQ
ncbi:redox-sensing transcriptional repressor Rex [Auraticoccus monumenti]|uniref:Redox-sensing transcriptional repressor Rex n=1 Tax=Auraticoccus monumenti TaxID=675864 RepID=A0A1G6RKN2_9ACTN|nr:redox-sensing transcriptional repressor Rex [Auraticoccus monumenti]SDD04953.1 redox-sensing transcriptional repressor [Auraticoccus monumenti]